MQVRLRLREELREILKATGISGVFVTHDQEEALAIADQVAVMRQGKIEQLGSPENVYTHPQTRFVAEFVTRANFLPAKRIGQLWETEIGCLLDIDTSENDRYTFLTPSIVLIFAIRLTHELKLIVHLKICFELYTADSDAILYLFPSLSNEASTFYFLIAL